MLSFMRSCLVSCVHAVISVYINGISLPWIEDSEGGYTYDLINTHLTSDTSDLTTFNIAADHVASGSNGHLRPQQQWCHVELSSWVRLHDKYASSFEQRQGSLCDKLFLLWYSPICHTCIRKPPYLEKVVACKGSSSMTRWFRTYLQGRPNIFLNTLEHGGISGVI